MDEKLVSVVTPCYNEEANVEEVYLRVKEVFDKFKKYQYEHIFIDNASSDKTVHVLKDIAKKDRRVKIIVNTRNFGAIRSSYYGLIQPKGDAAILIFADLQDPPSLIQDFLEKWAEGYKVVKGIKISSKEGFLLYSLRTFYYRLINKLSDDVKLSSHFTGFGLYDKCVIEALRTIDDPYPYLRGLISELGFESVEVEYKQERRKRGISSNNFYSLYDTAMLGLTSHSRVPLRLATLLGFVLSILCLFIAVASLITKLLFWNYFPVGIAAIIIGLFALASVQLFFIGILGEYIGLMNMRILKRPIIVERERINFDN